MGEDQNESVSGNEVALTRVGIKVNSIAIVLAVHEVSKWRAVFIKYDQDGNGEFDPQECKVPPTKLTTSQRAGAGVV